MVIMLLWLRIQRMIHHPTIQNMIDHQQTNWEVPVFRTHMETVEVQFIWNRYIQKHRTDSWHLSWSMEGSEAREKRYPLVIKRGN